MLDSERLTQAADWRWSSAKGMSLDQARRLAAAPRTYYPLIRAHLPTGAATFLELGGAPGYTSAPVVVDTDLVPTAVDFSENAGVYLKTMAAIGKEAALHQEDVFTFETLDRFDVVASFGLVEHFTGTQLDRLLDIHDSLLAPGGLLVISMPNFTGVHQYWHGLVDTPNLALHNLDAMTLDTFATFGLRGYTPIYVDYYGQFKVWGTSRFKRGDRHTPLSYAVGGINAGMNTVSSLAESAGVKLRGPLWSPDILYIGRKPDREG